MHSYVLTPKAHLEVKFENHHTSWSRLAEAVVDPKKTIIIAFTTDSTIVPYEPTGTVIQISIAQSEPMAFTAVGVFLAPTMEDKAAAIERMSHCPAVVLEEGAHMYLVVAELKFLVTVTNDPKPHYFRGIIDSCMFHVKLVPEQEDVEAAA